MRRLYENYRSEEYTELRKKWEGWYNFEYNDAHILPEWLDDRARIIIDFLNPHISLGKTHVVDIGGDTGEIASRLGAASYSVEDLSNRPNNLNNKNIKPEKSQLAVLAHVLEHVSDPRSELQALLRNFDEVYVEVPHGVPVVSKLRKSKFVFIWVLVSSFFPSAWRSISSASTGRAIPAKILRASEHLTFFTSEGIMRLAQSLGVTAHVRKSSVMAPISGKVEVIQVLFSKSAGK
jgi:2-polyprenyl-3-methyl-5-hydroxy-6-metoxy-1,4-benzoquinol methylase